MYKRSRQGIGYLAQEPSIFGKLSVEDNLKLVLEMTDLSKADQQAKIEQLLEGLTIQHLRNNKGNSLSGGERRRVEICRSLAIDPNFILLDEPFAGVDPIAVEDIQEDVLDILLNLKEASVGLNTSETATVIIEKEGPSQLTVADIESNGTDVSVFNPEKVIATINEGGKIRMTIRINTGVGYDVAVSRTVDSETIGSIQLDASFSPIKRVSFTVESARVEQKVNLDRLNIVIETNGSVDAEEAVKRAATILQDQLSSFVELEPVVEEEPQPTSDDFPPMYLSAVDELELTVRSANCLNVVFFLAILILRYYLNFPVGVYRLNPLLTLVHNCCIKFISPKCVLRTSPC